MRLKSGLIDFLLTRIGGRQLGSCLPALELLQSDRRLTIPLHTDRIKSLHLV
jgi:hypothetical protein